MGSGAFLEKLTQFYLNLAFHIDVLMAKFSAADHLLALLFFVPECC
jgi:hypothetical protein